MENHKACSVCKKTKPLEQFHKDKHQALGKAIRCKPCEHEKCLKYKRSKEGVITKMYSHQKERSIKRGHNPPSYTKEQFKEWVFTQDMFHQLYRNWVDSNYDKLKKPSVDRINDYGNYRFDNIQIVTWKKNLENSFKNIKEGFNTKTSISIAQYSMEGTFINRFYSQKQAEKETCVSKTAISKCRRGITKSAGGFIWKP